MLDKSKEQQLQDITHELSVMRYMQMDPLVKETGFISQESVEILLSIIQGEIESMADFIVEAEGVERLENIQEFKATVHSF